MESNEYIPFAFKVKVCYPIHWKRLHPLALYPSYIYHTVTHEIDWFNVKMFTPVNESERLNVKILLSLKFYISKKKNGHVFFIYCRYKQYAYSKYLRWYWKYCKIFILVYFVHFRFKRIYPVHGSGTKFWQLVSMCELAIHILPKILHGCIVYWLIDCKIALRSVQEYFTHIGMPPFLVKSLRLWSREGSLSCHTC